MKRRAALLLAVTAACGSSTDAVTVAADAPAARRPYRDLPEIPARRVPVELPSQYEIPARVRPPVRSSRGGARAGRGVVVRGRVSAAPGPDGGAPLACIRSHESDTSGGYGAVSSNGRWFGAYQFDQVTWDGAVFRAGHGSWAGVRPDRAPAEVQDAAARQLYSERGLQPWPPARNCA